MADLLECVIQIKALAETVPRLAALADRVADDRWRAVSAPGVPAPIEVVGHLADEELDFHAELRAMLAADVTRPERTAGAAPAGSSPYLTWPVVAVIDRFRRRRAGTLARLNACSADELGRLGCHPSRGAMTVADLVAVMLAHDTDHVGQIRERLGLLPGDTRPSPAD